MNAITPILPAGVRELPAPRAEAPLWTGRPAWLASATRVWKVRWAAAYFALLLVDGARIASAAPVGRSAAWAGEGRLLGIATALLAGLLVMAALTRRTTRYEIGEQAVTFRYGVALPATLVIPFAAIAQVSARTHADGTGDVALELKPGKGVIYPKLWPHARPWRLRRPEPMMRGVPDAGVAAALLCRALAARDRAQGAAISLPPRP